MSGFSTACPGGYENVDRGLAYVSTDWTLSGIMIFIVALRVYSRSFLTRSLGSDDITIVIASIFIIAGSVTDTGAHRWGFGRHCAYLSDERMAQIKKWDVAQWLIAFVCFFLIRTSVMLFTLRLLPRTKKKSVWAIYTAFAFNVAILLIAVISYALQCRPFEGIWKKIPNAQCVSIDVLAATNQVNAILAVFIDIVTASIPAFLLWGVQMRRKTKTTLHILFALGLLTAALSIGRAATITKSAFAVDMTWSIVTPFWFSILESKLGVMIASAPALRQMFSYRKRTHTMLPSNSRQTPNSDFESMRNRVNYRDWVWRGKRDPERAQGHLNGERLHNYDGFGSETRFGGTGSSVGSERGNFGATEPEDSPLNELEQRVVNVAGQNDAQKI